MLVSGVIVLGAVQHNPQEEYCEYVGYSLLREDVESSRLGQAFVYKFPKFETYKHIKHKNVYELYIQAKGKNIHQANFFVGGDPCHLNFEEISSLYLFTAFSFFAILILIVALVRYLLAFF